MPNPLVPESQLGFPSATFIQAESPNSQGQNLGNSPNAKLIQSLLRRHPRHIKNLDRWRLLEALSEGGEKVSNEVKAKILFNPSTRSPDVIKERVKAAPFKNLLGGVMLKIVAQLMREDPIYSSPTIDTDPFWKEEFFPASAILPGDTDGRASFNTMLARAMLHALMTKMALVQVEDKPTPGATNRKEQLQGGSLKPYLMLRSVADAWDYAIDRNGFVFVKLHCYKEERDQWDKQPIRVHEFQIYQRDSSGGVRSSVYRMTYRKDAQRKAGQAYEPFDIYNPASLESKMRDIEVQTVVQDVQIFQDRNGKTKFPVVALTLPPQLWLADQLLDIQVSHFNARAGAEFALHSTNYAMPVLTADKSVDEDYGDRVGSKKFADGFFLPLEPGVKMEWFERQGSGIERALSYCKELKGEIVECIYQISNEAANSYPGIARSAESKKADERQQEILLLVYGHLLKEFAKQILEVASIAHDETDTEWQVRGFDHFMKATLEEEVIEYKAIDETGLESPTLKQEAQKALMRNFANRLDIDKDRIAEMEKELEKYPFELPPDKASVLISADMPLPLLLATFKRAGYFPPEFTEEQMAKLIQPDPELQQQSTGDRPQEPPQQPTPIATPRRTPRGTRGGRGRRRNTTTEETSA